MGEAHGRVYTRCKLDTVILRRKRNRGCQSHQAEESELLKSHFGVGGLVAKERGLGGVLEDLMLESVSSREDGENSC